MNWEQSFDVQVRNAKLGQTAGKLLFFLHDDDDDDK